MNFYKKAILTLTGAGMLMGCTHKELEGPIHAVVVGTTTTTRSTTYYLDLDGDGLTDRGMTVSGNRFYKYMTVGDTVRYTTTNRNEVSLSACVPFANSNIVDVNGRTLDELQQRHMINNLRERLGQEKQR